MEETEKIFISVILPVYNRQNTIKEAIFSILGQTYSNFELIVVDDASLDDTPQVVESINDYRIKLYQHKENLGASAARNTGIRKAKGNWIAFHDSDDIWQPNKLLKQVNAIESSQHSELPIIYSSFYRYRGNKKEYIPPKDNRQKQGYIHKELLLGNFISTQTVLLPKAYIEDVGMFDADMPRFQDWELWIRLSEKYSFYWIDEPLVDVYYTMNSISSNSYGIVQAFEKIMVKHKTLFKSAGKKYYAGLLFSIGHNHCLYGHIRKGRRIVKSSLNINALSARAMISLIISLFGQRFYRKLYSIFEDRRLS